MSKKFQKNKEDFVCLQCREKTIGDGYTNHCQKCLWSLHMDINPGDRKSNCLGLMFPKNISQKNGMFSVIHRCQKCGLEKANKISKEDNFEKVIEISEKG